MIPSLSESLAQDKKEREPLAKDSPFLRHDSDEWLKMAGNGKLEKAYYTRIFNSLSNLQKSIINQHAKDIRKGSKERNSIWNQIRRTQTFQLVQSAAELGTRAVITWVGAPFSLFINPVQTAYVTLCFGSIYVFLYIANIIFLTAHVIGVGKLIRVLSERQAAGWSPVNWLNINLFNRKKQIVDNARLALSSEPISFDTPVHEGNDEIKNLSEQKPLEFNVDLARTILLMCSIIYERDTCFVQKAACASIHKGVNNDEPSEAVLYLVKSEEAMLRVASIWGLGFVAMADFGTLNGPFAGAFYDYDRNRLGPDDNPFIVIVVKGTSPDNFSEWLMDCTCKFEACGDFLGAGLAHDGFYRALFPSKSCGMKLLPYRRIVETVRVIANEAFRETGKKTNLFVGGHSLGAGIASLLYARLLEAPSDLGEHLVLRDAYLYGTPRACDFKLANRVEYNLLHPINHGRQLWRVANRAQSPVTGDIVTRVPPGIADKRSIRAGLQEGCYYAYAAIGTRVDLTPNASAPPFYSITDVPVGYAVSVFKKNDEAENEFARARQASKFVFPQDIVQLSMWLLTVCIPILHDHFPASYMDSLNKIQCKTSRVKKMEKASPGNAAANSPRQKTSTTNTLVSPLADQFQTSITKSKLF